MIKFHFYRELSCYIILSFIVFTIVGTLSHEMGHIAVAKYFGYEAHLSYGSMTYNKIGYNEDVDVQEFKSINKKYAEKGITNPNQLAPEDLKHFRNLLDRIEDKFPIKKIDSLLITIGGPSQTILTCLIGLLALYYRKTKQRDNYKIMDWLGVFLGLFILREVFNTIMALWYVSLGVETYFSGDEFTISRLLGMNQWVIPIITLVIGLVISIYIIFEVIPLKHRFTFIVSGFIGGILGYSIWFGFLGKLVFSEPISF